MSLRSLIPPLALVVVSGCGGGGGGGQKSSQIQPAVGLDIQFPGASCLTTDTTLTLRGTTTNGGLVADLTANSTQAASSDGFATWVAAAAVPLSTNVVRVEGTDVLGRSIGPKNVTVEVAAIPVSLEDVAFDPKRRQLICGNNNGNPLGLVALDLAGGRFVVVTGPGRGAGPKLSAFVGGSVVEPVADVAYVIGTSPKAVWEITLATGDRRIISDASSPGPAFGFPQEIDLDAPRGRVIVSDRNLRAMLAIDLVTGERSILSDATHGSGVGFDLPEAIKIVAAQDRLLVDDQERLLSVDLATGNRSLISDATRGTGPDFQRISDIGFDDASGAALVTDSGLVALLRVDLITGNRAIVSDGSTGSGPGLVGPAGVTMLDAADGRAAILDSSRAGLFAIDLATGDREELQTLRIGGGDRLGLTRDIAFDPGSDRVFASRIGVHDVIAIDAKTGARSLVSGTGRGSGAAFTEPTELAPAPSTGQLIVVDGDDTIVAVDLATGNRTLVSGNGTGSGVDLQNVEGLVVDDGRRLAIAADADFSGGALLVQVDLVDGARSELSGPNRGSGPLLSLPLDLALAPDGLTAFVSDRGIDALVRIDRVSGDRVIVSDATHGSGPVPSFVGGLVLSPDGTKAFATLSLNELMEIDLATGDRLVISGPTLGLGPAIGEDVQFDPTRNVFFCQTFARAAVIVIDPISGDRAVVSY